MEIERKFLLGEAPPDLSTHPEASLRQGYLALDPDGTEVRVRQEDDEATLTVKKGAGLSRVEEAVVLDDDAFERLWPLTAGRRVEKVRHRVPADDGLVVEVDVYGGDLAGLVVAEVEFADEAQAAAFVPQAWMGREVTGDRRYANQRLAVDGAPAD
jgi:CYTH domain-containing protein